MPKAPPPPQPPAFNPWDLLKLIPPAAESQPQMRQPTRRPTTSIRRPTEPAYREPTAEELASLSYEQLRVLLSETVETFGKQLNALNTGDAWETYFELDDLENALNVDSKTHMLSFSRRAATIPMRSTRDEVTGRDAEDAELIGKRQPGRPVAQSREDLASVDEQRTEIRDTRAGPFPKRPTREEVTGRDAEDAKLIGKRQPGRPVAQSREDLASIDEQRTEIRDTRTGPFPKRPTREEMSSPDSRVARLPGERPGRADSRQQLDQATRVESRRPEIPKKAGREFLETISERFAEVADKTEYRKISGLAGFQTLQLGLREYLLSPTIRQGREFSRNLEVFQHTLRGERTGETWQKYFETDAIDAMARSQESPKTAERELLEKVLQRFDNVSQDKRFDSVKKARGFQETHDALKSLVKAAKLEAGEIADSSPPAEEDKEKQPLVDE
jgi:hypothetical protein